MNQGWPMLPLFHIAKDGKCACGRYKCNPGKHPRISKWPQLASTEPSQIADWWNQWPDSNVGIVTGSKSGLLCLDVDPRNGGDEALKKLEQRIGKVSGDALTAQTGGGGQHLIFQHPGGYIKSKANELGAGLDIKADGGYIVAAPSNHISGGVYEWSSGLYDPPDVPEGLLNLLIGDFATNCKPDSYAKVGERNNHLASFAGKLRAKGYTRHKLEIALLEENALRCSPPKSPSEVKTIAKSIAKYERGTAFLFEWRDAIQSPAGPPNPTTRHVLLSLSTWMDLQGKSCFPTQEQIQTATGLTPKTIRKHIRLAEKQGWIKTYRRTEATSQTWNYGYIATPPLIELCGC